MAALSASRQSCATSPIARTPKALMRLVPALLGRELATYTAGGDDQ